MRFVRGFALAVAFGVFAGCSGSDGTGPYGGGGGGGGGGNTQCPANSVCMLSASFSPTTLTVNKNTQVSFVNNSGVGHDVNFDGTRPPGVDDIPLHSSGTNTRTFTTSGTFDYHCNQHAGMNGHIVVN